MIKATSISKNINAYYLANINPTQSITIDIQSEIHSSTFRSILSFCKQWNIKDIYIKLQNLAKTEVLDHLFYAIADTFLFSSEDFRFYLYYDNLENYIIKKFWGSNQAAKDFLLPYLIHTSNYEIQDRSLGMDIIRFFDPKPESYLLKAEKNNVSITLKYPDHVFAILMKSESTDDKFPSELIDVFEYFNPSTGNLTVPWKKGKEVTIYVIRKIYGWCDTSVQQRLNIFSSKIFISYIDFLNKHFNRYSSFFSGWVFNPIYQHPNLPYVVPAKEKISQIFNEQTDKDFTKTAISCWYRLSAQSHHQCFDFDNFNRKELQKALKTSLQKYNKSNNKDLKFFISDNITENINNRQENHLFDFAKILDKIELNISSPSTIPNGTYTYTQELPLRIAASVTHHFPGKKATLHWGDLLNTDSDFEHKLWQFHWLISCGLTDMNHSLVYSETEAAVNLYNDLPTFDPSYNAYEKWFKYINQMSNFAQRGKHKCDILLVYPSESICCGHVGEISEIIQILANSGFDFDIIDFETLVDTKLCKIEDRMLIINDEKYSILILPGTEVIPLPALRRIYDYYSAGGTVIATGELPSKSCNWEKDNEVEGISNEIWFRKSTLPSTNFKTNKWGGKGYYQSNMKILPEILRENKELLSLIVEPSNNNIRTLVRELPREYFLFFFNMSHDEIFNGTIYSRPKGQPFIWNFDEGKAEPLFAYKIKDMFMQFQLEIPPKQARLIIIKKESLKDIPKVINTNITKISNISTSRNRIKLTGFVSKQGKYHASVNLYNVIKDAEVDVDTFLPILKISNRNWNIEFNDKKILSSLYDISHNDQSFCGIVSYKKIVIILKEYLSGYKLLLDLGKVRNTVEVIINKKRLGILFAPPYLIDITNYLSEGDNIFNFKVSNNLSHKLSCLSFRQNNEAIIREFGLLGPVRIVPQKEIQITF